MQDSRSPPPPAAPHVCVLAHKHTCALTYIHEHTGLAGSPVWVPACLERGKGPGTSRSDLRGQAPERPGAAQPQGQEAKGTDVCGASCLETAGEKKVVGGTWRVAWHMAGAQRTGIVLWFMARPTASDPEPVL